MIKKIIFFILLIVASEISSASVSTIESMPIIEILGQKFYTFTANKNDTFFGIANLTGWDTTELQQYNPDAIAPFKKGTKLYYPVKEDDKPVVELSDTLSEPIRIEIPGLNHIVKKGERVSSVAQMYLIAESKLIQQNPSAINGIKEGDVLIIRTPFVYETNSSVLPPRNQYIYQIEEGEDLGVISQKYKVPVIDILKANPGLTVQNCKAGNTIILPQERTIIQIDTIIKKNPRVESFRQMAVKSSQNFDSIASSLNIELDVLKTLNANIKKFKNNQTIVFPVISTNEVIEIIKNEYQEDLSKSNLERIYNKYHNIADSRDKKHIRYAIIAENPSSNKDLEFIRGFLTGINEFKAEPYTINIKVIDGSSDEFAVIDSLATFEPTMIFLTSDKPIFESLAEYALDSKTPIVNTFDVKSSDYLKNPYFIQLLTPTTYFNDIVIANINDVYGDYDLFVIGEEDPADILGAGIIQNRNPEKYYSINITDIENIPLSEDRKILFYSFDTKKQQVEDVLNQILKLRAKDSSAEIAVLGRPNWLIFADALTSLLHSANTVIPSRFYNDVNSSEYQKFLYEYKYLFNRNPVKSVPFYAGMGYDNAVYFTQQLEKSSLDLNKFSASKSTMQSQFDLQRINNWSGFVNMPVYMIQFFPDRDTSFIVIE